MTKLNQIIAVEKNIKSRAHSVISELNNAIQRPDLFNGAVRKYLKKNEEDDDLPGERKHIQRRVSDVVGTMRSTQTDYLDVMVQRDLANTHAKAAVAVRGVQVLPELPATSLLQIEKTLTDYRTFFENMPLLDSSEDWTYDAEAGIYKTEPSYTVRTKKTAKVITLAPPTDKHPAQAQLVQEDVVAGKWETIRQSAAMPKTERDEIVARIDRLLIAVKEAREAANGAEADEKPQIGAAIFEYLLKK